MVSVMVKNSSQDGCKFGNKLFEYRAWYFIRA